MKHSFLVAGPQFYGYTSQIAAALRSAEHQVTLVPFAKPLPAVNAVVNRATKKLVIWSVYCSTYYSTRPGFRKTTRVFA